MLKAQHADFLLYLATGIGGYAFRMVMIPCLLKSLGLLDPGDDILQGCTLANEHIDKELKLLKDRHQKDTDQDLIVPQQPKLESTLKKKLCIGKFRRNEDSFAGSSVSGSMTTLASVNSNPTRNCIVM